MNDYFTNVGKVTRTLHYTILIMKLLHKRQTNKAPNHVFLSSEYSHDVIHDRNSASSISVTIEFVQMLLSDLILYVL